MTKVRTQPYYQQERVVPRLQNGENVLITAHGNPMRSVIMHIEKMTPQQIIDYEMETGVPHRYTFDDELRLIDKLIISNVDKAT